ncbi:MAG: hypothetical protein HFJ02_06520 [Bacilli bacterium]|nr:hypothetical protein [Bacilli bacterium]
MKLKKGPKIAIIFILLGLIASSFYTFNKWFFNKYHVVKDTSTEPEEKRNGKEVIKENVSIPEEKKEELQIPETPANLENRTKAKEVYYCLGNATLTDKKCISKLEMPAIKNNIKIENGKSRIIIGRRKTLYAIAGFTDLSEYSEEEIKEADTELQKAFKDLCKEYNGELDILEVIDDIEYACLIPKEKTSLVNSCLDESYTLEGDKCTKATSTDAKIRLECPKEYTLEGTECVKKLN